MTELEEEAEKGEDSQTGKASDNNTQVQFVGLVILSCNLHNCKTFQLCLKYVKYAFCNFLRTHEKSVLTVAWLLYYIQCSEHQGVVYAGIQCKG